MGAILIEIIPRGLQGYAGPRYRVPLLMVDYFNILYEMERTRLCIFLYQTTANGSEVSITESMAEF
jgi:hypothetical protein